MPPGNRKPVVDDDAIANLRRAALDPTPIHGLTHCFYRYPARFSPTFAAAASARRFVWRAVCSVAAHETLLHRAYLSR